MNRFIGTLMIAAGLMGFAAGAIFIVRDGNVARGLLDFVVSTFVIAIGVGHWSEVR